MNDKSEEKSSLEQQLEAAVDGLEMPSESDEPFRVFSLEIDSDSRIEKGKLSKLLELKHHEPVEERELDEFFESAATVEDWMEGEEKEIAQRFANLLDLLKVQLKDACVYLYGERERDAVIIGQSESGYAGLITLVVET